MTTPLAAGQSGARRRSQILRLPGGRGIGFAEFGDPEGAPVIALHGTPGSRLMFSLSDDPARERRLRLIAPERPGCGLSDYRRYQTLRHSAHEIAVLTRALDLRRFVIVGVSGGAPFAVAAAAALSSQVPLLALVSPMGPISDCASEVRLSKLHTLIFRRLAPLPLVMRAFFWSVKQILRVSPDLAYRGLKLRVAPSDRVLLDSTSVRASLQAAIVEGLRNGVDGAVQDLRLFSEPWRLSFDAIDVPAVMWQGRDDTIVPPDAAYWLAEKLPNCRLDVIQGAGHYWVFDHFERVLDAAAAALHG